MRSVIAHMRMACPPGVPNLGGRTTPNVGRYTCMRGHQAYSLKFVKSSKKNIKLLWPAEGRQFGGKEALRKLKVVLPLVMVIRCIVAWIDTWRTHVLAYAHGRVRSSYSWFEVFGVCERARMRLQVTASVNVSLRVRHKGVAVSRGLVFILFIY